MKQEQDTKYGPIDISAFQGIPSVYAKCYNSLPWTFTLISLLTGSPKKEMFTYAFLYKAYVE